MSSLSDYFEIYILPLYEELNELLDKDQEPILEKIKQMEIK